MLGLQQAGRTCTDGKQWYVCNAGPYTGCCSVDPCSDGVCPDEDSITTTKKVTTTSTSKSTSATLSTAETTTAVEETTSSSSSKTTSEASSEATSVATSSTASILSTSTSTSSATYSTTSAESAATLTSAVSASQTAVSTSSSHHSNSGMIGGVVGAAIAAILLALLLYFCIKRRRAKVKIKMHRSVSTQSLRAQDQTSTTKKSPSSSATALVATAKESPHSAASPASKTETSKSSLGNEIYHDYQSGPPSTLSSLTLSTLSNSNGPPTPPSKSSTSLAPLIIPTESPQSHLHHSLTPHVPELSDTGFRRQRAELPAQPQSELINQQWNNLNANSSLVSDQYPHGGLRKVGISEYTGRSFHTRDGVQNSGTDLISRNTARKIVTRDGVVMGANLDRMSSIDEVDVETPSPTPTATPLSPRTKFSGRYKKSSRSGTPVKSASASSGLGSSAGTPNQHVMSFMEYDAPSEMLELRGGGGDWSSDSESGRRNVKAQAERDASGALDVRNRGVEMDVLSEGQVGSKISGDRRGSSGWKKIKEDDG
ncbi:hypothetical protein N7509_004883 [Penicillium cosmopolitanum]|uniref:Uncharacterized protein n=1 Tax=Penicillium cosmopolitanum TaxID=1131564 RepID=A0A9W9W155_9EURO|nr:uncharacterized protein N7509_004883 [Penicillium cosmopolitanum]KAJ5396770.1 hypothetical protein N7509_004883 [Penicillium cosmopolitanum]